MTDSPWTFGSESSATGGSDAVTLVDGPTFAVSGRSGDVESGGAAGLYMLDTRILSCWQLRVNGRRIEPLSVSFDGPFCATFVGRVRIDDHAVDAPIAVVQRRYVGRGLREDLEIRHHGTDSVHLDVSLEVGADFRHVFDVKAGHVTDVEKCTISARSTGLSLTPGEGTATAVDRCLVASFPAPGSTTDAGQMLWAVDIDAGAAWTTCLEVTIEAGGAPIEPSSRCGSEIAHAVPVARLRNWQHSTTQVSTDHAGLAAAVERAVEDLGALRIFDPDHVDRTVVAAGAPWYMTLFGRDSLLTSWMALLVDHDLALGVLEELADAQGRRVDRDTEEQPGRILHEVRFDRLSARLLGGNGRYYGSVDATPLFVMLVAEVTRWIGPDERIAALMPAVDAAIEWIDRFGDRDGDGFVQYERSHPGGLEHQGWKDSWDGIRHADGTVAVPPIALSEVQGYVYAALRGRADLARVFEDGPDTIRSFDARAENLRSHFNDVFWSDEHHRYVVGLDADKQPIESVASNLGHLLWSGIVPESRQAGLAALLTSPEMFTGWGIRTLSARAEGYNPLSYHCGSVWPHDTALIVDGLARAHLDAEAASIAIGLLDASAFSNGRLPELFAGFDRSDIASPVPYPASCSPQAWSAASPLLLVRSMLGLAPDAPNRRLGVRPRLPSGVGRLAVTGLAVGPARVDISVDGDRVDANVTRGELDVRIE